MMYLIVSFLTSELVLNSLNIRKTFISLSDWFMLPFRLLALPFFGSKIAFQFSHFTHSRQRSLQGRILKFFIDL